MARNSQVVFAGNRELELFRADAKLADDARGLQLYIERGIKAYVLCLECGKHVTDVYSHLGFCDIVLSTNGVSRSIRYRLKWPGAVMRSWNEVQKQHDRGRKWYAAKSEEQKQAALEWAQNNPEARKAIVRRSQQKRIKAGKIKRYHQVMAYRTAEKVKEVEVEDLLATPALMAPRCICLALNPEHIREDSGRSQCGRVFKQHIDRHLETVHGQNWEEYSANLPGALRAPSDIDPPIVKALRVAASGITADLTAKIVELEQRIAKSKNATEQTVQIKKLDLLESARRKMNEPDKNPWMPPNEVAAVLGVKRTAFYDNVKKFRHLRKNPVTKWYATDSVIEQKRKT